MAPTLAGPNTEALIVSLSLLQRDMPVTLQDNAKLRVACATTPAA